MLEENKLPCHKLKYVLFVVLLTFMSRNNTNDPLIDNTHKTYDKVFKVIIPTY